MDLKIGHHENKILIFHGPLDIKGLILAINF